MKIIFTFLLISCALLSLAQQRCYLEADLDCYGDPYKFVPAITTGGCPLFYVSNSDDCDDNDPRVPSEHSKVWYRDIDNDGYYDGTTLESCTRPAGYRASLISQVIDCNDHDANIQPITWYRDDDHDGYARFLDDYIVSCTPPQDQRFSLSESLLKGPDCRDDDPNSYPRLYYIDADGDGYRSLADPLDVCIDVFEPPYRLASEFTSLDIDCD